MRLLHKKGVCEVTTQAKETGTSSYICVHDCGTSHFSKALRAASLRY